MNSGVAPLMVVLIAIASPLVPALGGVPALEIEGGASSYLLLTLGSDAGLEGIWLEAEASDVFVYVLGRSSFFLYRHGDQWTGPGPGWLDTSIMLPAGDYEIYAAAAGPFKLTLQLSHDAATLFSGAIPHPGIVMESLDRWLDLGSASISQRSVEVDAPTILAMLLSESQSLGVGGASRTRWLAQGLPYYCFTDIHLGTTSEVWGAGAYPDLPAGNLTLERTQVVGAATVTSHVLGVWIPRVVTYELPLASPNYSCGA